MISPFQCGFGALRHLETADTRRHCAWLAVNRPCIGRQKVKHFALLFMVLQALLLASSEGWKWEVITSHTPTNSTTFLIHHTSVSRAWVLHDFDLYYLLCKVCMCLEIYPWDLCVHGCVCVFMRCVVVQNLSLYLCIVLLDFNFINSLNDFNLHKLHDSLL